MAERTLEAAAAPRSRDTAVSARTAMLALVGLVAISTVVRYVLARELHGPFVFMDELGYQRMALSLARTRHFDLFGHTGLAYSPLYPVLLAPIYAVAHGATSAGRAVVALNALLMSAAAVPVYAIARSLLSRRLALGVAALSLVAPLMYYSALRMSEALAYPLFLAAVWALLRTLRAPGAANDALLLVAIALACAARLQHVALVPAALTAIVLVGAAAGPAGGRLRSALGELGRHRLLVGVTVAVGLAALARTLANGGTLPLAGRYAVVGNARPSPLRVAELFVRHLAGLDLAVGVLPFAAALVTAWLFVRRAFPRRAVPFAATALACTFCVLLEVGYDAAAFDLPRLAAVGDLPRIHERYLIYLVPFFLVTLVASLRTRPGMRVLAGAAVAAAALPAVIPYHLVVNNTIVADTFSLQVLAKVDRSGLFVPIPHARAVAVALAALLAFFWAFGVVRRPAIAVLVLVAVFAYLSSSERRRLLSAATAPDTVLPEQQRDWVDRIVSPDASVAILDAGRARPLALRETAYYNFSVARVYSTCGGAFGSDFGERSVTVDSGGAVWIDNALVRTPYLVAASSARPRGRVLAADLPGGLVLVAPPGGVVQVGSRAAAAPCRS